MADVAIEGQGTQGWEEEYYAPARPGEYRTFSIKLAPALTASGGALLFIGGLGTWIRVVKATSVVSPATEAGAVMGYAHKSGWGLAVLGLVLILSAAAWFPYVFRLKLAPIVGSIVGIASAGGRLVLLNNEANSMVKLARKKLGFVSYHAGFGWGSWLMLVACALLVLGLLAGVMREIDLRRGFPE